MNQTTAPPRLSHNLLEELNWRGLIHDQTPRLVDLLSGPGIGAYIGFDPTAPSLHIGNLAVVMLLVHLRRAGHQPIALVGGATGMIGDPSGKSEERNLLDVETLRHNQEQVRLQLEKLLSGSEKTGCQLILVNNYDWYNGMGVLDFLRNIGKLLTVNYMLAKDSVQKRLENGLSFTEFSYQLLQAYDFYHLYLHHNCRLQLGGSDQWGNITCGLELIRRLDGGEAHGLTAPLVTKADGSKFGKSESGNIWLDANLTSPYKFYQYWLNTADQDVEKLLKVFSLKSLPEIEALLASHALKPETREAQRALATELTARIHSDAAADRAQQSSEILFGSLPVEKFRTYTESELAEIFEGLPIGLLSAGSLHNGLTILDLIVESGLEPSRGEGKRSLQAGSIRINKEKVTDASQQIVIDQLLPGGYLLLQKGKKNYHLARFQD